MNYLLSDLGGGGDIEYTGPPRLRYAFDGCWHNLFETMVELRVNDPRVTDDVLEDVAELDGLRRLNLDCTDITDIGLEHLKGLRHLEKLSIAATNITDAGLERLKQHNLKCLNIAETKVTDEGIKKFQEELPNCRIERSNKE